MHVADIRYTSATLSVTGTQQDALPAYVQRLNILQYYRMIPYNDSQKLNTTGVGPVVAPGVMTTMANKP